MEPPSVAFWACDCLIYDGVSRNRAALLRNVSELTTLTIVMWLTIFLPARGIPENEMALIPATIPSLWGLDLVRPSEPLKT
jgi:hypothetical protein